MENEELARLLGHLPDGTAIWRQVGFAPEDEEGDTDDDTEVDDEGEEEDEEWTPPTREEWEATQRRLSRANKEAAKRRKALKARATEDDDEDEGDEEPETGKGTDRKELKRLLARAEARAEAKYKPALVKQAAKAALVDAGFNGEINARTIGLLNLDELEVDEDGEIVGLEDAIEELKEDVPALFKRTRTGSASKTATGRKGLDGGNKKVAKKPMSHAERVAAQLLGG